MHLLPHQGGFKEALLAADRGANRRGKRLTRAVASGGMNRQSTAPGSKYGRRGEGNKHGRETSGLETSMNWNQGWNRNQQGRGGQGKAREDCGALPASTLHIEVMMGKPSTKKKPEGRYGFQVSWAPQNLSGCRIRRFASRRYLGKARNALEDGYISLPMQFRRTQGKQANVRG